MGVEVRDNADEKRFEAWIDDELCGIAESVPMSRRW